MEGKKIMDQIMSAAEDHRYTVSLRFFAFGLPDVRTISGVLIRVDTVIIGIDIDNVTSFVFILKLHVIDEFLNRR